MKKIHRKIADSFYYFGEAVTLVASGLLSVLIAPAANAAPFVCGATLQSYNALGYNQVDNYMYAIDKTNDGLNND